MSPQDTILKSECNFGFKKEKTQINCSGWTMKAQWFSPDVSYYNMEVIENLFQLKSMRDFNVLQRMVEIDAGISVKKKDRNNSGDLKSVELVDLI